MSTSGGGGGIGAPVYPKLPRVSVRDSFADDDELSDIDDEVFVRDGKHGILNLVHHNGRLDEECGVKRPLMAPRRRAKISGIDDNNTSRTTLPWKSLIAPLGCTMIGLLLIIGIIAVCIAAITRFPGTGNVVKSWFNSDNDDKGMKKELLAPCTMLNSKVIWIRSLPRLTSEAPLRSSYVNDDKVLDVIVGFSTGLDTSEATDYLCKLYFHRNAPCLGGVIALDGYMSTTLWTHWTPHAIFSVDCGLDLNGDNKKDCVIAGRGGILHAVNGRDGTSIWELPYRDVTTASERYFDIYDARYIADMDDDGIGDVVASHTWQSDGSSQSEVIIVSGKNGNKIHTLDFPGKEQLFVAPQVLVHPDGETYLILVASDEQKSGGLYIIPHSNLLKGDFKLQKLYHGPGRGVSLPPLLIDINSDGTEDLIVAMFNSTIRAFDGLTFKEIWNFTIDNSEVISIPVPGYYNDDNVPDFMVKHQIGPGFPVYYYTTATILDGKTGKPILEEPMEDTMSGQMSGLSVTVEGYGNDWFLHWSANCMGHEGAKDKYEFVQGSDPDADLCKLRFNSSLVTSLYGYSRFVGPPGKSLYNSEKWKKIEMNYTDPREAADDYVNANPEYNSGLAREEVSVDNQSKDEQPTRNNPGSYYEKGQEAPYPQQPSGNIESENNGWRTNNNNYNSDNNNNNNNKWSESENNGYRDNVAVPPEDTYDEAYDDEDERLLASRQLNEIRLQRSEKSKGGRYINNDTNDVQNQLDPSMDYTNGQSKQHNYYSALPFNRSSNAEDNNNDYMNLPDIDFVDNLKEVEALTSRRRKRAASMDQSRLRPKRQAGRPVQRQPPTGMLLPSLEGGSPRTRRSIDLLISTYWLPASSTPFVLLPRDLDCLARKAKEIGSVRLTTEQRESAVAECLAERGIMEQRAYQEAADKENAPIGLGQMNIYRIELSCGCPEDLKPGQTCKDFAPSQSWPEHLGASIGGYFKSLRGNNGGTGKNG